MAFGKKRKGLELFMVIMVIGSAIVALSVLGIGVDLISGIASGDMGDAANLEEGKSVLRDAKDVCKNPSVVKTGSVDIKGSRDDSNSIETCQNNKNLCYNGERLGREKIDCEININGCSGSNGYKIQGGSYEVSYVDRADAVSITCTGQ